MKTVSRFVGLDVHKDSIAISVAEASGGQARFLCTLPNDYPHLLRTFKKLGDPGDVHCCYEAGPTGFGLCRRLMNDGYACVVVAPGLIPVKAGNRVKTDRRDSLKLAHFLRSGDLTPVNIPDEKTESIRDLERARDDAKRDDVRARHRLGKFLLRHDRIWPGKTNWTGVHMEWIRRQTFEQEPQNQVLREYLRKLDEATASLIRLDQAISEAVKTWVLQPLVQAYQALRGVQLLTATVIAAEIGDMRRFPSAKQFMSFVGLTPSENSSGDTTRRGPITKAGNGHLRRVLVEAAWNYRRPPRMTPRIKRRTKDLDPAIEAIAWKAQERLHLVYRRLAGRGRLRTLVITAVARQRAGFVGAIGTKALERSAA